MPSGRLPSPPRFGGMCECGDHAWANLSRGLVTLVSPEDAGLIDSDCWSSSVCNPPTLAYAMRGNGRARRLLHRLVASPTPGQVVDHANGNGLDNRRPNVRACSQRENARNMYAARAGKRSRFKGISFDRRSGSWRAAIRTETKNKHLGLYADEVKAAMAYDAAALIHHGAFAKTNAMLGLL